jgi:hypothetical protein
MMQIDNNSYHVPRHVAFWGSGFSNPGDSKPEASYGLRVACCPVPAAVRSRGRMPGKSEVRTTHCPTGAAEANDEWKGVERRRGPSGPGKEHNVRIISRFGAGASQENQG